MSLCKEESLRTAYLLYGQEIRNMAGKILQPYDLTVEQTDLLKNTSVNTGIIQKELSVIANKPPTNLTRILDRQVTLVA